MLDGTNENYPSPEDEELIFDCGPLGEELPPSYPPSLSPPSELSLAAKAIALNELTGQIFDSKKLTHGWMSVYLILACTIVGTCWANYSEKPFETATFLRDVRTMAKEIAEKK
jgi:hypothetical protein